MASIPTSEAGRGYERTGAGRIAVACGIGTSLEFYDFAIYGTAAALVFTETFFRTDDAWFGTFMGLATFAIGFLMAPLGAVLFGWVGDRYGRKLSLLLTFVGMGVATLAMGLLPTYAQIGVMAPVLLVLLRLIHGLTRGGETSGAAVLAVEHAPLHRRALYGSFVALGSPIGMILANAAFALVLLMPADSVQSWGWRVPFLVGGLVLVLGIWIRKGVAESPVFKEMMAAEGSAPRQVPIVGVFRTNWRRILLAAGVNIGLNASTFALATFMLSYATADAPNGLELPRQAIVTASILGLALHAAANLGSAVLSDRIGRRPVMIGGAVASICSALTMFHIAQAGSVAAVGAAIALGFLCTGFLFGPMYTFFTELFPREQRQSGMGIAYHVGAVLGGGISPMIANRIIAGTGDALNIGYYLAAACLLSLVCLLALPETAPVRVGVPDEDADGGGDPEPQPAAGRA